MRDAHQITQLLELTLADVRSHGPLTWQRVEDWLRVERTAGDSNRGGGVGNAKTDERIKEQIDDRQASAYFPELARLTDRIDADLNRLRRIMQIANPDNPKAQPDAGCRSCYRNGGQYEPVWDGRYRMACRFCGEWRTEHGEWPPLHIIRWRHRNPGKRLPLSIVEQAS